jgi:hypothetical protein
VNFAPLADPRKKIVEDLRAQIDHFMATGKKVQPVASFPERSPLPPRSNYVDPDTVLKRKRRRLNNADRQQVRRITEAI